MPPETSNEADVARDVEEGSGCRGEDAVRAAEIRMSSVKLGSRRPSARR
jgi:hypothetical protein